MNFGDINIASKDTINYFLHRQMKYSDERQIKVMLSDRENISLTLKLNNIMSKLDTALDQYVKHILEQDLKADQKTITVNQESLKEFLQAYDACKFNYDAINEGNVEQYINYIYDQYEEDKWYSEQDCKIINRAITAFMQNSDTLEQYLDFDTLKERTFYVDQEQGDWLRDAEIENIIKKQLGSEQPITIIQDVSVLGISQLSQEQLEARCQLHASNGKIEQDIVEQLLIDDSKVYDEKFQKIAVEIQNSPNGYVHAFILGTMTQKNAAGHWYTLVVYAERGKRSYYVMDSLGINRVHDPNIVQVINELEKAIAAARA